MGFQEGVLVGLLDIKDGKGGARLIINKDNWMCYPLQLNRHGKKSFLEVDELPIGPQIPHFWHLFYLTLVRYHFGGTTLVR